MGVFGGALPELRDQLRLAKVAILYGDQTILYSPTHLYSSSFSVPSPLAQ